MEDNSKIKHMVEIEIGYARCKGSSWLALMRERYSLCREQGYEREKGRNCLLFYVVGVGLLVPLSDVLLFLFLLLLFCLVPDRCGERESPVLPARGGLDRYPTLIFISQLVLQ